MPTVHPPNDCVAVYDKEVGQIGNSIVSMAQEQGMSALAFSMMLAGFIELIKLLFLLAGQLNVAHKSEFCSKLPHYL